MTNIAPMPSVQESLAHYSRFLFRYFVPASLLFSVIPLSEALYLGTNGNVLFAPIAALILLIASGLVCVSWLILDGLLWIIGRTSSFLFGRLVFCGSHEYIVVAYYVVKSKRKRECSQEHSYFLDGDLHLDFLLRPLASCLSRLLSSLSPYMCLLTTGTRIPHSSQSDRRCSTCSSLQSTRR